MHFKKIITLVLLILSYNLLKAQTSFESNLIYTQRQKLNKLYNELMQEALSVEILNKDLLPLLTPWKSRKGEASFVYEVSDTDSLLNVYITELWWYSSLDDEVIVRDYIVFADDNNVGFTSDKVSQYKLNPMSQEIINYLFKYVNENMKFKVKKPRQRNLKFNRLSF